MQINLNEKETKILVNALRGFLHNLQGANEQLLEFEAGRPQGCCHDGGESLAMLRRHCNEEEDFCRELRDKLKKHQMKFPLEEHKEQRQFNSSF